MVRFLIDARPDKSIRDVAEELFLLRGLLGDVVDGFLFNGRAVRWLPGDTVAKILERYATEDA